MKVKYYFRFPREKCHTLIIINAIERYPLCHVEDIKQMLVYMTAFYCLCFIFIARVMEAPRNCRCKDALHEALIVNLNFFMSTFLLELKNWKLVLLQIQIQLYILVTCLKIKLTHALVFT